ncbi:MAG: MltA domain-containing protein [Candidatus Delongbacteria bacterium]|nr:MltA domain-containing protein [Candidatus Delongbacteria bacterium]
MINLKFCSKLQGIKYRKGAIIKKIFFTLQIILFLFSCTGIKDKSYSFKNIEDSKLYIEDDQSTKENLKLSIIRQMEYFRKKYDETSVYANLSISNSRMFESLKRLYDIIDLDKETFNNIINDEFEIKTLENEHGMTEFTSYYSPVFKGSLSKDSTHVWPLYRIPDNLFYIETDNFDSTFIKKGNSSSSSRVAALVDFKTKTIKPVFSRDEIDFQKAFLDSDLALIYLKDYFDLFTMHVQGGGYVSVSDTVIYKFDYAGKNSRKYSSIGKILVNEGKIPREKISMQTIREYLENNPDELRRVCSSNESYVFYKMTEKPYSRIDNSMAPNGSLGFPVTPKRSIAMDKKIFSGGGIFYIEGFDEDHNLSVKSIVIDQDTGGAINKNHLDYYAGIGDEAGEFAGKFRITNGKIYLLLLKNWE